MLMDLVQPFIMFLVFWSLWMLCGILLGTQLWLAWCIVVLTNCLYIVFCGSLNFQKAIFVNVFSVFILHVALALILFIFCGNVICLLNVMPRMFGYFLSVGGWVNCVMSGCTLDWCFSDVRGAIDYLDGDVVKWFCVNHCFMDQM